jgi:hypothetical protein
VSTAEVARLYPRGETEGGVVPLEHYIGFVPEWNHCRDRTENLRARDLHVVFNAREYRGIDKKALAGPRRSAQSCFGAFVFADINVALTRLNCSLETSGPIVVAGSIGSPAVTFDA